MKPDWQTADGSIRLYNADCLAVLPTLEAGSVDAVVTDLPYGVGLVTKSSDYRDSAAFDNGESLRATVLYQDDQEHVRRLIHQVMPAIQALCGRMLIFPGSRMLNEYPKAATIGCVFTPNGAGRSSWGFQCCHPILFYGRDPFGATLPNSFRTEQPNRERIDHPCPKPTPWMVWCVNRASVAGETVLDPFMGSGTTGVAAARLGRKFIGVEIEPKYFEIAVKRIEAELSRTPLFEPAPVIQRTFV